MNEPSIKYISWHCIRYKQNTFGRIRLSIDDICEALGLRSRDLRSIPLAPAEDDAHFDKVTIKFGLSLATHEKELSVLKIKMSSQDPPDMIGPDTTKLKHIQTYIARAHCTSNKTNKIIIIIITQIIIIYFIIIQLLLPQQ